MWIKRKMSLAVSDCQLLGCDSCLKRPALVLVFSPCISGQAVKQRVVKELGCITASACRWFPVLLGGPENSSEPTVVTTKAACD